MDNMKIRKAQLEKLDAFVHSLYLESQTFGQYMNMKDLEMLYLHIHELIQEMLQCKNTDEFMAMIEDLHRAIAGVLIIAIPANANQVKQDMEEAHDGFSGNTFDEMLQNLTKSSVQKFGGASKERSNSETVSKESEGTEEEEEVENDPDELIDMLDLGDVVKKTNDKLKKRKKQLEEELKPKKDDDEDPMADLYDSFE